METGGQSDSAMDLNPDRPSRELARRSLAAGNLRERVVTPEDIVGVFLAALKPSTRRGYEGDLRDFALFLGVESTAEGVQALVGGGHGAANALALEYRIHLTNRGLSAATIARRLTALKSVVQLVRQLGQISWQLDVQSPKVQAYRDTRGPGDEGWTAMRQRATERARSGEPVRVRDRAILRVAHDLALRVSEVTGLDLADVEEEGGGPSSVWILGKGRTGKERLTLAEPTAQALAAWIVVRGREPGPLFTRLDRALRDFTRLTDRSVRRMVTREGKAAGVSRRVRPHGLRHHAITSALDRTKGNVAEVQRFSRHVDPRTLMLYNDRRMDGAAEVGRLVADPDE